jgi:hypothetical protein
MMFQKKPTHVYLGEVWHDPSNRHDRREEDHNLYFYNETQEYMVVEDVEYVSGPHVSCYHVIHSMERYVSQHSDRRAIIDAMIRSHQAADDACRT